MSKNAQNYRTIALTSHASKVMPKILQARLQQYVNHELPDVQAERQRNQRSNCQHPLDHGKSKGVPEKHLFQNFPQFIVIHTVKGFGIVNKAELMFFWNSFAFSMIQRMLAI